MKIDTAERQAIIDAAIAESLNITQQVLKAILVLTTQPDPTGKSAELASHLTHWSDMPNIDPRAARMIYDLGAGLAALSAAPSKAKN